MDDELNIDFYLLIRIFLSVLNNKQISNRIAELYSKITIKRLNKEINNDFNLYQMYADLNLDIIYSEEEFTFKEIKIKDQELSQKTKFRIHFVDYLNLASYLRDDFRRLVNNPLQNGYVFIQPEDLNRLVQEVVRRKFIDQVNIDDIKEELLKIQEFKELFENINAIWDLKKEEFEFELELTFDKSQDLKNHFPPCIQEIINKLKEGQNLIHTERLFIVWFLNALNYPEQEIIDIFATLPDFNREKTGYQVRYAIKKGYTPYSCKTLKTYTLCMAKKYKDKLCMKGYFSKKLNTQKQVSHPLFYVRYNQFVSAIKKKNIIERQVDNE
jgi:DNA primase large subunit